jgi:hypothetical protein
VPSIYSVLSVAGSPGGKCKGMTCKYIHISKKTKMVIMIIITIYKETPQKNIQTKTQGKESDI